MRSKQHLLYPATCEIPSPWWTNSVVDRKLSRTIARAVGPSRSSRVSPIVPQGKAPKAAQGPRGCHVLPSHDPRTGAGLHAPSVLPADLVEGVGDLAEGAGADGLEQFRKEVASGTGNALQPGEGVGGGALPGG